MKERPIVKKLENGGEYWENTFEHFYLKTYVPKNGINGKMNNYTFRAPLLLVFEEDKSTIEDAVKFAEESGLAKIAAAVDSTVLFVYPTCDGGWDNASVELYREIMKEVKMDPLYDDGICEVHNFFTREFEGYFIRGAKFRTDIYSFGKSADYVAKNLLTTVEGEYLWGPGEITPAMCSMERLSADIVPDRKDIAIISVGNTSKINDNFKECENLLVKEKADYVSDFYSFVKKFKMWVGKITFEPDFDELGMIEEPGIMTVNTTEHQIGAFVGTQSHEVGYFAYYNKGLFDNGPVPLVIGFHGGGDSSFFFTFVSEWYKVANKYGFLYVSMENHQNLPADEAIQVIEELKNRYSIDEHRIYATGFSMGCMKTWDLFQTYPEVFAGIAPGCALFKVKDNPFSYVPEGGINMTVPVPVFYSGGEDSPLPELPFQDEGSLERVKYAATVNKLKKSFDDVSFENKDNWENKIWGLNGDRAEKLYDETRDSYLTIEYFDSEDGVCRTAFGSVSGQQHELRHHSCETAWKFISKFTR